MQAVIGIRSSAVESLFQEGDANALGSTNLFQRARRPRPVFDHLAEQGQMDGNHAVIFR